MNTKLQTSIEQLARTAVMADANDLNALVGLIDAAKDLTLAFETAGLAEAAGAATNIAHFAEQIVLREAADSVETFAKILRQVESLQNVSQSSEAAPAKGADDGDAALLAQWITHCDGSLSDLEEQVLALERDPAAKEPGQEIRRVVHTLKGECGVLSLHALQKLCHEAETLIDDRTAAGAPFPADVVLSLVDWTRTYVGRLAQDSGAKPDGHEEVLRQILAARGVSPEAAPATPAPSPAPVAEAHIDAPVAEGPIEVILGQGSDDNLADFLCESREHVSGAEEALMALDNNREDLELINTVFRAFHTIKGVAGFMQLGPIVSLSHTAEQLLDGARSGTVKLGREHLDAVLNACDMLSRLVGVLEGGPAPSHAELNRLLKRLERCCTLSAEEADRMSSQATPARPMPEASAPANERSDAPGSARDQAAPAQQASTAKRADQTVKVSTQRMDGLVTMVGELVIAQQMVIQDAGSLGAAGQRIQRTLSHVGKIVRDLHEVSMALRMVSLKSTFQRMTRLVRDVSAKAGKQIVCVTEGEDVELDRNVVEEIADPLVHMIRNACDHGIEPASDRTSTGKNPVGRVALRAYHSGGSIVIEIEDDGRGLRRDKIIKKARERNLIPADLDEKTLPDSEVFSFIFLPGFSTADKVTDISGRGVGMDVVRRNIEALRGKVEIRSTPGKGTVFLMRLPLTMAIIDGMVVRVGGQRYVLPTLSIQQSFRPQSKDVHTTMGDGETAMVRGSILPIYRLNRVLNLREGRENVTDALLIVLESDGTRYCLMVDEILGQQQVVIKTLTQTGQTLKGVSGGAILGDGRVALILDVVGIESIATSQSTPSRAGRAQLSEAAA